MKDAKWDWKHHLDKACIRITSPDIFLVDGGA